MGSQIQILNISRLHEIPPNSVYIGRNPEIYRRCRGAGVPPWGNPFVIGRDGSRGEVVRRFAIELERRMRDQSFVDRMIRELLGAENLICHCVQRGREDPTCCHGYPMRDAIERIRASLYDSVSGAASDC